MASTTTTSVSTEDILSAVNAIQEEAIDFLKKIVSIESTLEKGEGTVQNIIYDHLVHVLADDDDDLFKIERIPVQLDKIKDQRGYSPVDWEYTDDQKFNVVARYNNSDGKNDDERALLLQGHVDVVPADEVDGWTHPPFSPLIKDERHN